MGRRCESFSASFVLSEEQVVALSVPVLTHLLLAGGTKCLHSTCIHVITHKGGCVVAVTFTHTWSLWVLPPFVHVVSLQISASECHRFIVAASGTPYVP